MADILSQSQIDALLTGISTGDVDVEENINTDQRKVKEYDFRSPKKFTKEQLKVINSIHENIGRVLASYFSGTFRFFSEVEVMSVEEQRYYEYNNALPENVLIGMIDLKPDDSMVEEMTMLMDLSSNIGYFIIDRMLGGSGENFTLNRDFTDMELSILKSVFVKINKYVEDAWKGYIETTSVVRSIETNSRLMQAFLPDDTVVIVVLAVTIRDFSTNVTICIPAVQLESIMNCFNTGNANYGKRKNTVEDTNKRDFVLESISKSKLEVKGVLDEIELGVYDILGLKVNDIIPLNRSIHDPVEIKVENAPWFKGNVGQTKVRKAIRVTKIIDERGNVNG